MTFTLVPRALLSLLLFLVAGLPVANARVVTFAYQEDTAICGTGENWDFVLNDFHVDCGNANHGCTPGHNIMIYGEFEARSMFYTVADVEIEACVLGNMICTPNVIETDMNVCMDLQLWDVDGEEYCNSPGNYTFETTYMLPNHTWWEDFAFEGLTFSIYVTFDQDLTCHATFTTHIYYGNEAWMIVAVGSTALVLGAWYYIQKKRQEQGCGMMNLTCVCAEDTTQDDDERRKEPPKNPSLPSSDTDDAKKPSFLSIERPSLTSKDTNDTKKPTFLSKLKPTFLKKNSKTPALADIATDDDSVTTTSYLRVLDFSPSGLKHADRMEAVRRAHFDRLRRSRDSRRSSCRVMLP